MKRTIWVSEADTSNAAIDEYREFLEDGEQFSRAEIIEMIEDDNQEYFYDAEANLNIPTEGKILCIADLGLWYGRRQGYRILDRQNVNAIFGVTCGDYVDFYGDCYNVHCDDAHHDGTNHYLFRELRYREEECQSLLDAIYNGKEISSSMLNRYTRSILPYVADVYGWPVAGRKKAAQ